MIKAKLMNGYNMVRVGRFDVVHSHEDDMLTVTFIADNGRLERNYIHGNGDASREIVDGREYDAKPCDSFNNTPELTIKPMTEGFKIEFSEK